MTCYTENVLGVFVLEDDEIIGQERFPEDPGEIAEVLREGSEEKEALLAEHGNPAKVQKDILEIAEKAGINKNDSEIRNLQWQVSQEFTERELKSGEDRDQLLVQAVRALSEIDDAKHSMIERLRSWYSLYFPEAEDKVGDHERFVELVSSDFTRERVSDSEGIDENSTGIDLDKEDRDILQKFAEDVECMQERRRDLKTYIERLAGEVAPNMSAVLGELLAARMISEAGSLEKLAKMPSSTVQVLGAEKALFRHMRGEGSAPKHGLLFMHSKVRSVSEDKRGKMARFVANKTSIAARLDNFGGEYKGASLSDEVEQKYEEITEEQR